MLLHVVPVTKVNGYQRRKDRVPFDATEMMKKIQEYLGTCLKRNNTFLCAFR